MNFTVQKKKIVKNNQIVMAQTTWLAYGVWHERKILNLNNEVQFEVKEEVYYHNQSSHIYSIGTLDDFHHCH